MYFYFLFLKKIKQMAILKEEIKGTKIYNEIQSSNIIRTEYDMENETMIVEFNNGTKYEYEKVPHKIYTQFRLAESQGRFFSSSISRGYKYKKI
jgi:hypothetical protein